MDCLSFSSAGGKAGAMRPCSGCKGRGIKVTVRQIGPGMVQQMQSMCNECHGEGETRSSVKRGSVQALNCRLNVKVHAFYR